IAFLPEWVEAVLIAPDLGAAGRTDGIVTMTGCDVPLIADLKTGTSLDSGLTTYAAQLAGYAGASHRWTGDGWAEMLPVDQATGLLIHAPLGTATCTIHALDLLAGREIVELCATVRQRRRGASKLAKQLEVPGQLDAELAASVKASEPAEPTTEPQKVSDILPAVLAEMGAPADVVAAAQAERPTVLAAEPAVEAAHIDDLAARTDWIRGRLAAIAAISDPKGKDA